MAQTPPSSRSLKSTTRAKAGQRKTAAKPPKSRTVRSGDAATAAAPVPRRAVFIDVENTSSESDLLRVLDDLAIERGVTEFNAVGNWRVIGHQLGRTLAERGAQLVHSAPATRVPDWSDLWIAVSAGMWLGRSAPGDTLVIVSDDRAFDAVGDAAARLGVVFRRITYRTSPGTAERAAAEPGAAESGDRRRRRRRPRARTQDRDTRPPVAASAPTVAASGDEERHAASQEQIRTTIARLTAGDRARGVNLDALVVALKAEGFQRPPGSPRLVTRLRRLKDVELLPNGRVRLIEGADGISAAATPAPSASAADPAAAPDHVDDAEAPKRRARRSRRGGRRRSARRRAAQDSAPGPAS